MRVVKKKLRDGFPKTEIFEDAVERGLSTKKVSRFLASIPDAPVQPLYINLNYLLAGLYLSNIAFAVLILLTNLSPDIGLKGLVLVLGITLFIPGIITFYLFRMHAWVYLILLFFVIRGLFDLFGYFSFSDPYAVFELLYRTLIIGLAIFLKIKLFPFQNFLQSRKTLNDQFSFTAN